MRASVYALDRFSFGLQTALASRVNLAPGRTIFAIRRRLDSLTQHRPVRR